MVALRVLMWPAIVLTSTAAQADPLSPACVSLVGQQTAALIGRDFQALERFARRFLDQCRKSEPSDSIASAYENLGIALFEQGRFADAAKAALGTAERLIEEALPRMRLEAARAAPGPKREAADAALDKMDSLRGLAAGLRAEYGD